METLSREKIKIEFLHNIEKLKEEIELTDILFYINNNKRHASLQLLTGRSEFFKNIFKQIREIGINFFKANNNSPKSNKIKIPKKSNIVY